jgi:tryptophanyl-tRNA synthetase
MKNRKRVLAGMRPTNLLHIGNYLGSAKGMISLQEDENYETFYMVVDLHAITTPYSKDTLCNATRNVILDYLAVGLDPEKSTLFVQSDLADLHAQLAFYLSSVVTVARMRHLPTFKEKIKQHPENVTMALLNYPVLMAADILMYKAHLVPVGLDQNPHIEVAREIARKMNEQYGTEFPEPKRFATRGEYIPSLTGEGKMSKSVEGSFISLTDDLETIREGMAKVPTDGGKGTIVDGSKGNVSRDKKYLIENGEESTGVKSLMELVELFQGLEKREEYEERYKGVGIRYKELKEELAGAIYTELKPIQDRRKTYEDNPSLVDRILEEGAEKARVVAGETVREVKEKMGLV